MLLNGLKESFFLLMVIGLYSPKNKQNTIIHIFGKIDFINPWEGK
jgi:hypothetical protein